MKKIELPEIRIMTIEEAKKLINLLNECDNKIVYLANKLAACTGLRMGELLGLRGECVLVDHLLIKGTISGRNYSDFKLSNNRRNVPIAAVMRSELEELLKANGSGYVFSSDGGNTPISANLIKKHFNIALEKIGIRGDKRHSRKLCFHSWRQFFINNLRMHSLSALKISSVTGIKPVNLMDYYTRFDKKNYKEVMDVQEGMFDGLKTI